jgi:Skp family chaperone for outer membrane proteins
MRTKTGIAIGCLTLCAAALLRAQSVSVAVVDLEELIRLHPNTARDKKVLEQTLKDYKAEGEDLQRRIEALQEDFEKARKEAQDPALSDKARRVAEESAARKGEELSAASRQARDKMQLRQQMLSEQQMRMVRTTTEDIREAVGKYAAERKVLLVLPQAAVLYQDKALDITDAVMKRMNIQRPPPGAETGAEGGDTPAARPAAARPAPAPKPAASEAGAPEK